MSTAIQGGCGGAMRPSPPGLADVVGTIMDKGLLINAYVPVAMAGIELETVGARVVVASVDTCLRFAEAVSTLYISQEEEGLPGLAGEMDQGGADDAAAGVQDTVTGVQDTVTGALEAVSGILGDVAGGRQRGSQRRRRGTPR